MINLETDRNQIALTLYTNAMKTAVNLNALTVQERKDAFDGVTKLVFEMANSFFNTAEAIVKKEIEGE